MKSRIYLLISYSFLIIASCAKMGSLAGGLKDEEPPRVLESKPVNFSTGFTGQKIEVTFDEFIVLKDINRELIISPPLKERPDIRLRNKTIIIDLKNELKNNTTYTLNFGKSISDNNEGNILTNYEFVFSTGDFLDSLSVEGWVLNAFDLQPSKDPLNVMLYNIMEDSIPLKEIPVYIGKTDIKGSFRINNLSADTYKIFVLKDQNYNFLFDLPNEEIAFADTFLPLTPEFLRTLPFRKEKSDSISLRPRVQNLPAQNLPSQNVPVQRGPVQRGPVKKVSVAPSVTQDDSIKRKPVLPAIYVDMFYFTEESNIQYLSFNQRKSSEHLEFGFNLPVKEELLLNPLNFKPSGEWHIAEINLARDTFNLWLTDTTVINQDSLKIEIGFPAVDTAGNIYQRIDTINFLYRKPIKTRTRRSEEKETEEIQKLNIITIRNRSNLDLNRSIPFTFNFPLEKTDTSLINLFMTRDSVERRISYEIQRDTISLRKITLHNKWLDKTPYRLLIFPGAFTDIYGNTNDTIKSVFNSTEIESYGTLILNISGVEAQMIVQLMNNKEKILEEKFISKDSKLIIEYLAPGQYILKFIYDRNGNRKWDTGNYLKNIQPEKVSYYKDEITIRANWELEVKWSAGDDQ